MATEPVMYETRIDLGRQAWLSLARLLNQRLADMIDLFNQTKHAYWNLTLPPLEAAGFLLHRERPAVAGLTLAPQAFNLSVCPTVKSILIPSSLMFFAAL